MQNDPNKMDEQLNKIFPISNSGGKWNVPFVRRFPYILLSISVIFTLGTASVLSVVGVTLYRLTMSTILSGLDTSDLITDNAVLIASATSVLINFACVQILNELFGRCAKARDPRTIYVRFGPGSVYGSLEKTLTEWELPKTDADYEKSYTLKMFIFQAVNFWSSIFYIAFVKGRGTGTPLHYTRFGGSGSIRLEECHPSGCLFDLTMQLAIIMILKQAIGNVMELGVPFFKGYLRKKKESGFEGKPWKRDICLEQEPIYKLHFYHYSWHCNMLAKCNTFNFK